MILVFAAVLLLMAYLLKLRTIKIPENAGVCESTIPQALLLSQTEDDSDIKIAGEKPGKPQVDTVSEANELERQRECGNLEKAHALGAALSEKIISTDGEYAFGQDTSEDGKMRTQRRMLLAFAACNAVESNINSEVLQGVVLNIFYDTLKKDLPEFYNDINETGSFSFYKLCVRRDDNVAHCVGGCFAMLSGNGDDKVVEDLGEALYLHFLDVANQTIQSFKIKQ